MELVAMELKQQGSYIARSLSYEGVEFKQVRACVLRTRTNPARPTINDTNHVIQMKEVEHSRSIARINGTRVQPRARCLSS